MSFILGRWRGREEKILFAFFLGGQERERIKKEEVSALAGTGSHGFRHESS